MERGLSCPAEIAVERLPAEDSRAGVLVGCPADKVTAEMFVTGEGVG